MTFMEHIITTPSGDRLLVVMVSMMLLSLMHVKELKYSYALVNTYVTLSSVVTVVGVKYCITFLTPFGVFVFTATYMRYSVFSFPVFAIYTHTHTQTDKNIPLEKTHTRVGDFLIP